MAFREFATNKDDAKKNYDECLERKIKFKQDHEEILSRNISLVNGDEPKDTG